MILTGGISENNFSIGKPNFIITSSKISLPSIKDFEKGMKLITHDFKRTIASSKSTNYLMAIWLQEKIHSLKVMMLYIHQIKKFWNCQEQTFLW